MSELNTIWYLVANIFSQATEFFSQMMMFVPMYLAYEMPLFALITLGVLKWRRENAKLLKQPSHYFPKVSCIITCYAEGDAVKTTIESLVEQTYPGEVEIIAVVDGAVQNKHTYAVASFCMKNIKRAKRHIRVLPKWQRGGRVSTLNAGLDAAKGDIVVNVDADTSFDNDMLCRIVRLFEDPNVPAVGGALRVRNVTSSIWTRMQAIEYLVSMQGGKTGLAQWNLINNISGAFGAFRKDFLKQIGGWDTHTAEDLDLTIRIKQYFKRHPNLKIPYATLAIGHTDAPDDFKTLLWQRLRWDGDLLFLYFRKHWPAFSPKLLGWKSFLFTLLYGFLQNVMLPFVVLVYLIATMIIYPWQFIVSLSLVIFTLYFFTIAYFYALVLLGVSERPKQDLKLAVWLPLYPIYSMIMRTICCFALLNELVRRSHEESSMAPWWVLKKGQRF